MKIENFLLEHWLNPRCNGARVNLGTSCVKAFHLREFIEFIGMDADKFLMDLGDLDLHYGDFEGSPRLKKAIAGIYKNANPEFVLTVHGGTGANNMVFTELMEKGENAVVVVPTYQQHYSIPQNLGYETRKLNLKVEDDFLPNIQELDKIVDKNTKIISLTNPNNPSGTYANEEKLKQIIEIARKNDAYILCDEIYKGLADEYMPSIIDLYEKGIVTSSMSKVYSMAGTRVGWIVVNDQETFDAMFNRRSYDTICGAVFDEYISALCLENNDKVLERSRELVNKNKKIFMDWIDNEPHLQACGESFGTTALVKFKYDMTGEELCKRLYEEDGILLCHGETYEEPKCFRLGFGTDEPENVKINLDELSKALKKFE